MNIGPFWHKVYQIRQLYETGIVVYQNSQIDQSAIERIWHTTPINVTFAPTNTTIITIMNHPIKYFKRILFRSREYTQQAFALQCQTITKQSIPESKTLFIFDFSLNNRQQQTTEINYKREPVSLKKDINNKSL